MIVSSVSCSVHVSVYVCLCFYLSLHDRSVPTSVYVMSMLVYASSSTSVYVLVFDPVSALSRSSFDRSPSQGKCERRCPRKNAVVTLWEGWGGRGQDSHPHQPEEGQCPGMLSPMK